MAKVSSIGPVTKVATTGLPSVSANPDLANWREVLPALSGSVVMLREPVVADSLPLLTALPEGALGLIVPDPPSASVTGLESFIERVQRMRRAGTLACWAIVPPEGDVPVGLIGLRALDHAATLVEGVAVLGDEFRGTPLFQSAARLALAFAFERMGVHRIEFRVDVQNGRANGALRKLGALQEGVLRRARITESEACDQVLWAMLSSDWRTPHHVHSASIH
jgi:ribosomal-protein-alanine N-acetyltransferase